MLTEKCVMIASLLKYGVYFQNTPYFTNPIFLVWEVKVPGLSTGMYLSPINQQKGF